MYVHVKNSKWVFVKACEVQKLELSPVLYINVLIIHIVKTNCCIKAAVSCGEDIWIYVQFVD